MYVLQMQRQINNVLCSNSRVPCWSKEIFAAGSIRLKKAVMQKNYIPCL